MKTPLRALSLLALLLFFSSLLSAQAPQPVYKEIILGFNDESFEKKIAGAENSIRALGGVLWAARCGTHQLLFVVYDSKTLTDPKQIFDELNQLLMKYEIKQDATISRVRQELCPGTGDDNPGN